MQRIVSFLPSATELLYELNAQDMIYGVTHECLYPEDAKSKPKVINAVFDPQKMTSKEIDEKTTSLLKDGKDIFVLNEKNLQDANPDLIISQETCEVCAAYTNQVNKAVQILGKKPQLLSMDPHNITEILDSTRKLAKLIGKEEKGETIITELQKRINFIKKHNIAKKPKVLAIEWIDPFFTAGHWVPEMIEVAGGQNQISSIGEHSRRMEFSEIIDCNPDMIVLMPCGFDTERAVLEYQNSLQQNKEWNKLQAVKENKVIAVDADSYFSKPSIRTVTGIEILAKIMHPEIFNDLKVPQNSYKIIEN